MYLYNLATICSLMYIGWVKNPRTCYFRLRIFYLYADSKGEQQGNDFKNMHFLE